MQRINIIVLIVMVAVCLVSCQNKESETFSLEQMQPQEQENTMNEQEDGENTGSIFVYVCGAVNCEGVYELPSGSRMYEAIDKAGGFRDDANAVEMNQAKVLQDEERIYVPVIGEVVQNVSEEEGKVNINKASKEELMTLPGVGESRAQSIIQYREEQGTFQSIEDIMKVSGIKEGLFEKIKDLITI